MTVTAYAPSAGGINCDSNCDVTASGLSPEVGMVACPREYEFGTKFFIPGLGIRTCRDRGGRITDKRLDVLMKTRQEALEWGVKVLPVFVLEDF